MHLITFLWQLDKKNIYAPYGKGIPLKTPAPKDMRSPLKLKGKYSNEGDSEEHHIYPRIIFKQGNVPGMLNRTPTIIVTHEMHKYLHKLLAEAKYREYEKEIKNEAEGDISRMEIAKEIIKGILALP